MLLSQPVSARGCNFHLYVLIGSLLLAVCLEVFHRVLYTIKDQSTTFKCVFAFLILQSKLLIVIRYRIGHRGESLSSLQRDTKLPLRYLIAPTILKLGIYVLAVHIRSYINTSLFGFVIFLNLVLFEIKNHFSIYQKKQTFILQTVKVTGVVLFGVGLALSAFDPMPWDNSFLYWGTALLMVILIQGILYLTKKLFDVYKPSTDEFLTKQYLLELLTIIISSVIVLMVKFDFNSKGIDTFIGKLQQEVLSLNITRDLVVYTIGSCILLPITNINLFNMIKELTGNECFFMVSGFVFWLNLVSLVKNTFNIFNFLSQFIFAMAIILYFRIIKLKYLIRFVNFLTRKGRSPQAPIPLH